MEATTSTNQWLIDTTHSEVQFKVKHLLISTVTGQFLKFDGTLESQGENFDNAKTTFEAEIESINTNLADRDAHLKSADFFDANTFPKLTFESTSFINKGGDKYAITGNLTLKDMTKTITLDAHYGGKMTDFYNQTKVGFEISGSINRKDFGLNWSAVTEAGGIVVSDEVKLILNVQFTQKS